MTEAGTIAPVIKEIHIKIYRWKTLHLYLHLFIANINKLVQDKIKLFFQNILEHDLYWIDKHYSYYLYLEFTNKSVPFYIHTGG